jgi:hypothetical protein
LPRLLQEARAIILMRVLSRLVPPAHLFPSR